MSVPPATARRSVAALALSLAAAACVAPPAGPPPPSAPVAPPPLPAPAPRTTDWRDIPLTPGDWRYDPTGPLARFGLPGMPVFVVRCDPASRTVTLARTATGPAPATMTMTITTSAGDRALAATPLGAPPTASAATLPARDGFLDRMAFSRGRFIVAVTGMPRLAIPAWPEFARVVEDCRG